MVNYQDSAGNYTAPQYDTQPQHDTQQKIADHIDSAIEGTSEKLNQLAEKIESTGHGSSSSVDQTAQKVAEQVRRGADTLQSTSAEKLGEEIQQTIRNHPLLSMAIAFGVGFVTSQLLKR
jgi:ElaB/YqjD/DUF883 family membrane-anchored ribosome-binding protein